MKETLKLILGGLILWGGALAAEAMFHAPVTVLGFNLLVLIPRVGAAFWIMIGIGFFAFPRRGDEPGDKSARVSAYFIVLAVGTFISYLILLLPHVAALGPIRLLKDYSTGAFQPSGLSSFFFRVCLLCIYHKPNSCDV